MIKFSLVHRRSSVSCDSCEAVVKSISNLKIRGRKVHESRSLKLFKGVRSTKESLMFTVEGKVEETMFLETSHTKEGLKSTVEVVEDPKEIDRGEVGVVVFKDSSRSSEVAKVDVPLWGVSFVKEGCRESHAAPCQSLGLAGEVLL